MFGYKIKSYGERYNNVKVRVKIKRKKLFSIIFILFLFSLIVVGILCYLGI